MEKCQPKVWMDVQEPEEEDSSPFCSLSWSQAQRPPSGHPNTKYCLEIWVTLTEELGAIPPPSHSVDGPTGRIHAVQSNNWTHSKQWWLDTGRTVLFYGRHSMGEGFTWWMRLEMPHSSSQELVHGCKNQPTPLPTQWQFKRVRVAIA